MAAWQMEKLGELYGSFFVTLSLQFRTVTRMLFSGAQETSREPAASRKERLEPSQPGVPNLGR